MFSEIVVTAERAVTGSEADQSTLAQLLDGIDLAGAGEPEDRAYLAVLLDWLGMREQAMLALRLGGGEHGDGGARKRNLAGILASGRGDYERAYELFGRALADTGDGTSLRAKILANLAALSLLDGEVRAASAWLAQANDACGQLGDAATDVLLASTEFGIARVRNELPGMREAVARLNRATRARAKELGSDHPLALTAVASLAAAEFELAATEESVENQERAIAVLEVAAHRLAADLGADHPQTLACMENLCVADLRLALGSGRMDRSRRAARALESVSRHMAAAVGEGHPLARAAAANAASASLDREDGQVPDSGVDPAGEKLHQIPVTAFSELADNEVRNALSHELAQLTGNSTFTVVEFDADAANIFEVFRDKHGTPTAVRWEYPYVDGVLRTGEPDRWSDAMADPERFYLRVAPEFIVRTPDQLPSGLRNLLPGPREVPVHECVTPLRELLRAAMKADPLVLGYELAVIKRVPADQTGTEGLVLTGQPLFPPGATQGDFVRIHVTCEPTDDEGIVFAVVTREPRPGLPWQTRRLRPLQVQTAVVSPGSYALTAVLTRPGKVRFEGLPVPLGDSRRSWDYLNRLVPDRQTAQAPVHLVCLIEVCGGDDLLLQQRIYRLEELISMAQASGGPLRVSVIAYGAHGVAWMVEDKPPEVRAWAMSGDEAINALRGLVNRRVDEREYQGAAQLECALKLVRERLTSADGRPVIVTTGGRPAHPPGLDTEMQLIPCPDWVDGTSELGRLLGLPGIRFGAVRDPKYRGWIWEQLGQHAAATTDEAVDMESFAEGLGLRMATQTVPFPVIE